MNEAETALDQTATEASLEVEATSAAPSAPQDPKEINRRSFLLQQLASASGGKLAQGEANKISKPVQRDLGLTAREATKVRDELAAEGLLRKSREKRTITYEITEKGREYLTQLPVYIPAQGRSRGGVIDAENEDIRRWRTSYLLLQLLREDRPFTQAEVNRFDAVARKYLQLNAATAKLLRHELARKGLLEVTTSGRVETYRLTPEGRLHLGTLDLYPAEQFHLKGEVINRLLEAARESAKQFEEAPVAEAVQPTMPTQEELASAVMDAFAELRREKHHRSGLVPIHEVRERIRAGFNPDAASHAVLDEVILDLWRTEQLRLVPISDPGTATPEQLADAIPGRGETIFYLEAAHEHATTG